MGTSGNLSTSNQYVKYTINITQNSRDIANNYTSVTVTVRFFRTNSGYQTYGTGTCYCKINGTTYSAAVTPSQKITNAGINLFSRTMNIYHETDGSKYLDTSAWISMDTPLTSSEQWYGEWLTTIPRASTPTLGSSSVSMGNSVTIYTNRASSSFTHVLYYQVSGGGWNWIASSVSTSYSWTVPLDFASRVPNGTSLSVEIICETYNGSTYIGSKNVFFTANVPSSIVPSISSIVLSETVDGILNKFSGYVQSKSKIKGVITAAGSYSSTIKAYNSNTNSQTFTTSTFTTNEIVNSGSQFVTTTITDSRGRTASKVTNYTVIPYQNPTITSFAVTRANSSGTPDDKGAYVLCTISAEISPANNLNNKSFKIKWNTSGESTVTVDVTPSSGYTLNITYLASNINVDKEYTFTLELTDYFTTTSQSRPIPTAFTLMDYNANGKALAIGKVSTVNNIFDIALTTRFEQGVEHDDIAYFLGNTTFFAGTTANFNSTSNFTGTTTISGEQIIFSSGTWTPSIRARNGTNPSYALQYRYARYKRFNNMCYISFHGKWNITAKGTDYACITGLPFTSSNNMNGQSLALHEMFGGINTDATRVGIIPDNSARIDLQGNHGAYSASWQTGETWIGFSGWYIIA